MMDNNQQINQDKHLVEKGYTGQEIDIWLGKVTAYIGDGDFESLYNLAVFLDVPYLYIKQTYDKYESWFQIVITILQRVRSRYDPDEMCNFIKDLYDAAKRANIPEILFIPVYDN